MNYLSDDRIPLVTRTALADMALALATAQVEVELAKLGKSTKNVRDASFTMCDIRDMFDTLAVKAASYL